VPGSVLSSVPVSVTVPGWRSTVGAGPDGTCGQRDRDTHMVSLSFEGTVVLWPLWGCL
jgi:hypothetical protein